MSIAPRFLILGLLPAQPFLDAPVRTEVSAVVVDHVRRALDAAPAHIRWGIAALASALVLWVGLFAAATRPWLGRRQAALQALRLFEAVPRLGPALLRVYRSLALLAFYDHPAVARAMGWEDAQERQDRHRDIRRRLREARP